MSTSKSFQRLRYVLLTGLLSAFAAPACCPGARDCSARIQTLSVRLVASEMRGPLDAEIPLYARVRLARVAGARDGCAAVVWLRDSQSDALTWDDQQKCWRVKGSDQTFEPDSYVPPPRVVVREPQLPREGDLFPPGHYFGGALVGRDGVAGVSFLSGLGADTPIWYWGLGSLAWTGQVWTLAVGAAEYRFDDRTDGGGIVLSDLADDGWSKVRLVIPERYGQPVGLEVRSSGLDLFWLEEYSRRWDLPEFMGGKGRQRLNYTRVEEDRAVSTKSVYEESDPASRDDHRVIALGPNRYDLIVRWHDLRKHVEDAPERLLHIPNLLGARWRSERVVATFDPCSSFAALARPGGVLQLVWLEPLPPHRRLEPATSTRLVECHSDGGTWTKATVLYTGEAVEPDSLAAGAISVGGSHLVVVVWRGKSGKLAYCLSPSVDAWAEPEAGEVEIGSTNWLASCGDRLVLITLRGDNLYWCYLDLSNDPRLTEGQRSETLEGAALEP